MINPQSTSPYTRHIHVLVVATSDDITLPGRLLSAEGFVLDYAHDGVEALYKAYELLPDLIVTDVSIPNTNGYQLCRLLKNDSVTCKIPIVLIAPEEYEVQRFWLFKTRPDIVLYKHQVAEQLVSQVRLILEVYSQVDFEEKVHLRQGILSHTRFNAPVRLNHELDTLLIEASLAEEFSKLYDLVSDLSVLNFMLFSLLGSVLEYNLAVIYYHEPHTSQPLVTFHIPDNVKISQSNLEELARQLPKELGAQDSQCSLFAEPRFEVVGTVSESDTTESCVFTTCFTRHLYSDDSWIGSLVLYSDYAVQFDQIFPVEPLFRQLQTLMKMRYLYSHSLVLSSTDRLTGLLDYRNFMLALEREFKRSQRYGLTFTLALIDIDKFRYTNERWGHLVGDEIIRTVAKAIQHSLRTSDIVARSGAEEFMILLPETTLENAQVALGRLQEHIASTPIHVQDKTLNMTVCIGMLALNEGQGLPMHDLLKQLDLILLSAQSQGRNSIICSTIDADTEHAAH